MRLYVEIINRNNNSKFDLWNMPKSNKMLIFE